MTFPKPCHVNMEKEAKSKPNKRLHRSLKGGRENWLPNVGLGRRPPFKPGEACRSPVL